MKWAAGKVGEEISAPQIHTMSSRIILWIIDAGNDMNMSKVEVS